MVEKRVTGILIVVVAALLVYNIFTTNRGSTQGEEYAVAADDTETGAAIAPLRKRVFLTSNLYTGNLGGLQGADIKCQQAATNASLRGRWVAWLSVQIVSNITNNTIIHAKDRIPDARYILLNGTVVADDKADLTDGTIDNPIQMNEFRQIVPSTGAWPSVWTGTNSAGLATGGDCKGWTTVTNQLMGTIGQYANTSYQWTAWSSLICNYAPQRLYCFEK